MRENFCTMFKVMGEGFSFRLSRLKDNILGERWRHLVYILSDKKLYGLNQGNFVAPFCPLSEYFSQIKEETKHIINGGEHEITGHSTFHNKTKNIARQYEFLIK